MINLRSILCFLCMGAVAGCSSAQAHEDWRVVWQGDGMSLEARISAEGEPPEVRGEVDLRASIERVRAVIEDVEGGKHWMASCVEMERVAILIAGRDGI